jgi:acyl-CoA synthetase (AMP-forming)/AMP-acid ligase II
MMQRFFKDPELTEEVCRNRWIHTNDIGYKDEDGFVYFVANKTDTIELGRVAGRISSLEIESVIDSHPDVSESVVFGVSGGGDDEAIKAVVIPENDQLTPIDVSNHCERQLAYHKLPRYIEICDNLPRTSADKVQKDALQETQTSKGVWDREGGYNLQQ